jgi:hypothetical protein
MLGMARCLCWSQLQHDRPWEHQRPLVASTLVCVYVLSCHNRLHMACQNTQPGHGVGKTSVAEKSSALLQVTLLTVVHGVWRR